MDLFILLGTLFFVLRHRHADFLCARRSARWPAHLWIGIPAEAVMLKISDGVSKVAMLTIPFFVLAGAIMAEGGMARRLVAFANVLVGIRARARRPVGGEYSRHHVSQRHFRLVGRRHLRDRLGDDPADGKGRLSARLRHQRHHQRLGAGDPGAAQPQRRDLFAGDRRHHFDHQPVHGRRGAGPAARLLADRAVHLHRLSRRPSDRHRGAAARGGHASRSTRRGA